MLCVQESTTSNACPLRTLSGRGQFRELVALLSGLTGRGDRKEVEKWKCRDEDVDAGARNEGGEKGEEDKEPFTR